MHKKIKWITQTAIMLALLVTLQALTKPMGQWVTGSCVNAILAVTVLIAGLWSGMTVALISPVLAFLMGVAPQILVVPAIMIGNAVFVLVLHFVADSNPKNVAMQFVAWLSAAAVKFAALYALVVYLLCDVLAQDLIASGNMAPKLVKALPLQFGVTQLFTALIGGAVALMIAPVLRKALRK